MIATTLTLTVIHDETLFPDDGALPSFLIRCLTSREKLDINPRGVSAVYFEETA